MNIIHLFSYSFVVSNLERFSDALLLKIKKNQPCTVLPTTMNEIFLGQQNPILFQNISAFSYRTMDGMPLVFLAQLKHASEAQRIYGPDLLIKMCEKGQKQKLKYFFYGTTPNTLQRLQRKLLLQFPKIHIVGSY